MLRALLVVLLLGSAQTGLCGSWEGPAQIKHININGNGWPYTAIALEGIVHQEPNCNGNQKVAMMSYEHPAYESFLSVVLAAKISAKPIKLLVNGCNEFGYPLIKELQIE